MMLFPDNRPKSPLRRLVNALALVFTIIVCLVFIASAWCSVVSPDQCRYAVFGPLVFPIAFALIWITLIVDLIWWRRTALLCVLSMLACYPQMREFAPLNLPKGKMHEQQQERSFTIMTYNVWQFNNQKPSTNRSSNEQIDYILDVSPDIVCIEESHCLAPSADNKITQEQLADLGEAYPYIYVESDQIALLSKFEAQPIHIDYPRADFSTGSMAAWRLNIHGEVVNLFVVHLRSFQLSDEDKQLFKDMTTPDEVSEQYISEISEARHDLMPKVISSAFDRNRQVQLLLSYIRKYGGENVIVCGDFNDPVGCYELHMLQEEAQLRSVYSQVGFGPMITYNAKHFYYRIDHILYRGCLAPWSIQRGSLTASDHYPVMATMLVTR